METFVAKRIDCIIKQSENDECDLPVRNWMISQSAVEPILQKGPQCGIVALSMALNTLLSSNPVKLDDLMRQAVELNFTKHGEIFDINYLYKLAKWNNCTRVKICHLSDDNNNDKNHHSSAEENSEIHLLERLLLNPEKNNGESNEGDNTYTNANTQKKPPSLILIAYDCDRNHEPCNKSGKKAHWALVTGVVAPLHHQNQNNTESNENNDNNSNHAQQFKYLARNYSYLKKYVHVICKHGKSRHSGVWQLTQLLESNRQLKQCDEEKCSLDEGYVRPPDGDIQLGLASKYLLLS